MSLHILQKILLGFDYSRNGYKQSNFWEVVRFEHSPWSVIQIIIVAILNYRNFKNNNAVPNNAPYRARLIWDNKALLL